MGASVTGVAYVIDVLRANCTVMLIGEHEFDDINVDSVNVRLRNPNEFMDLNHQYIYQGVVSDNVLSLIHI